MQVLRNGGRGLGGAPQDLVSGANGMIGSKALQDNTWPYWWVVPRANVQYVQRVCSMIAPANNTLVEVTDTGSGALCEVNVPVGFRFVLRAIRQTFQTGITGAPVFIDGSGEILWTIDVDNPIGSTPLSSFGLPDFTNMADQRGSQLGPWQVEGYNVFDSYQIIRYKVKTTVAIAPGAPNYITCGLYGWYEKALEL